jgi:hypothetical protein
MNDPVADAIFQDLQQQVNALSVRITESTQKGARAETGGGVQSFTYATAPRAAQGGMSDGSAYIDLVWISNGRSAAEGAGLGTGQLCYYKASVDDYYTVRGDTLVTI